MIFFSIFFCYAGWKSLHILIAIIKLSGLNIFIHFMCIYIFCERRRTKKCSSNQNARNEAFLPACQHVILHTSAQTGYIISAFTFATQTEQEWQANINNLIFFPGILVLLLTVLWIFSPVNNTWCIVVMLSLVIWSVCVHVFRGRDFGRVGHSLSVLSG